MKKKILILLPFFILFCFSQTGCGTDKEKATERTNVSKKIEVPISFEIKTVYGALPGNYTTMDEYYIDKYGNKVWHGHRKNFYPGGALKFDAYYEHGKNIWNKKYDEVGNEIP